MASGRVIMLKLLVKLTMSLPLQEDHDYRGSVAVNERYEDPPSSLQFSSQDMPSPVSVSCPL